MPQEIPPRLEFPVDVTEKEYIEASLIAARRIGSLRPTPVIVAAAAALCAVGLLAFSWFASPLLPIMLCVLGLLLAIAFFTMEPANIRKRARRDYQTYKELMKDSVVRLYADDVRTDTALVRLTDQYALLALCVETPELLVFLKDRDRLLILPKRCLPAEPKGRRAGVSPPRLYSQAQGDAPLVFLIEAPGTGFLCKEEGCYGTETYRPERADDPREYSSSPFRFTGCGREARPFHPGGRYSGDLVPGRYLLWPLYFAVPFYSGMSAGVRRVFDDL